MIKANRFSITVDKKKGNWGRFILSPLPSGFGHTVALSLRRTLLGSLSGAAVIQMKVTGANHLFTTLKGLKEDLVEVMLKVRQMRFKYDGDEPVTLILDKKGVGEVKAGDTQLQPGVELANPDLVLGHLTDKKARLKIALTVASGVGFEGAEEHDSNKTGVVGVDAHFSPIEKVSYNVEATRQGKKADLDKLVLEVETDGTVKPKTAFIRAAEILSQVFEQIVDPQEIEKKTKKKESNKSLDLLVEEVEDIPLRLGNALKKGGYKKLADFVDADVGEITKIRNVGEKSVKLLTKVLKKYHIEFK